MRDGVGGWVLQVRARAMNQEQHSCSSLICADTHTHSAEETHRSASLSHQHSLRRFLSCCLEALSLFRTVPQLPSAAVSATNPPPFLPTLHCDWLKHSSTALQVKKKKKQLNPLVTLLAFSISLICFSFSPSILPCPSLPTPPPTPFISGPLFLQQTGAADNVTWDTNHNNNDSWIRHTHSLDLYLCPPPSQTHTHTLPKSLISTDKWCSLKPPTGQKQAMQ